MDNATKNTVIVRYDPKVTLGVAASFIALMIAARFIFDYFSYSLESDRLLFAVSLGVGFGSALGWENRTKGSKADELSTLKIIAYSVISQIAFLAMALLIMFV